MTKNQGTAQYLYGKACFICVLVSMYQKVREYEGFVKFQYKLNASKHKIEYRNVFL